MDRWQATSPLYRAACAVITDWEAHGIDPCQGHLHGRDIRDRDTPYFAGFGLRYFNAIPACLTEYGGLEWLEVIHPTWTKPVDALRIRPRDRSRLHQGPLGVAIAPPPRAVESDPALRTGPSARGE